MCLISTMRQRYADWRREQRVAYHASRVKDLTEAGDYAAAMSSWRRMSDEVANRSPEQVARMERKRGLR